MFALPLIAALVPGAFSAKPAAANNVGHPWVMKFENTFKTNKIACGHLFPPLLEQIVERENQRWRARIRADNKHPLFKLSDKELQELKKYHAVGQTIKMPVDPNSTGKPTERWFVLEPRGENGPTMRYYEPNRNGTLINNKLPLVLSTERGELKPVMHDSVSYKPGTASWERYPTLIFDAARMKGGAEEAAALRLVFKSDLERIHFGNKIHHILVQNMNLKIVKIEIEQIFEDAAVSFEESPKKNIAWCCRR